MTALRGPDGLKTVTVEPTFVEAAPVAQPRSQPDRATSVTRRSARGLLDVVVADEGKALPRPLEVPDQLRTGADAPVAMRRPLDAGPPAGLDNY